MPTSTLERQEITCIFCDGTTPSRVVIEENGYDGRQCRGCGLIFVSPRPSLEAIIEIYGHDEAFVSAESHLGAGFSKRLYARHSLRILRKFKTSGDLLEIGAGAGFFLDEARKQGFNPFAIEFNGVQANHIRRNLGIPCEAKPLVEQPFPGQSFDVVYHCDVVSHFHDPIAEFRAFHESLRDDGLLMFETGNLGDVDHRYFKAIQRFQYPDHLFFFSRKNILQLLEATGFELLSVHSYSTLADVWTTRARSRIRRFARSLGHGDPVGGGSGTTAPQVAVTSVRASATSGARRVTNWIKCADQYANYVMRYGVGRFMPKRERPQTLIFVARKRSVE